MLATIRTLFLGLAASCLCAASHHSHAQPSPAACERTQVIFVNGVWNDLPEDARASARALSRALRESGADLSQARPLQVHWNPGDGYLVDVGEVLRTRLGLTPAQRAELALQTWVSAHLSKLAQPPSVDFARFTEELTERLTYESSQRRPVVVVAHSQGNLLTNRAVAALLRDRPSIADELAVVGVGVADNQTAGSNYRYVTSSRDLIITPLPALSANFSFPLIGGGDWTGHAFVGSYLSDDVLGTFAGESTPRSLRSVVGGLTRDAFDSVRCLPTAVRLENPQPLRPRIFEQFTYVARIVPSEAVRGRTVAGTVLFRDESGATLCETSVDSRSGLAECTTTYLGQARQTSLTVSFQGSARHAASSSGQLSINVEMPSWNIALLPSALTLAYGDGRQLEVNVSQENQLLLPRPPLAWESSNESAVTVTPQGVVRAVGFGTARISAVGATGDSGSSIVTVSDPLTDCEIHRFESYVTMTCLWPGSRIARRMEFVFDNGGRRVIYFDESGARFRDVDVFPTNISKKSCQGLLCVTGYFGPTLARWTIEEMWPDTQLMRPRTRSVRSYTDFNTASYNNGSFTQTCDTAGNCSDSNSTLVRYLDPSSAPTRAEVDALFPWDVTDMLMYRYNVRVPTPWPPGVPSPIGPER